MLELNVPEVLRRIGPNDRVLDVGGWARCFNRADYVLDKFPFETRGARYGERLGLGPQGGELERFSAETWVTRDLCDREPWPFPDRFFDYCMCSHTLEDIRDPLWVCSEMRRVAKAGYIETPSMAFELTRGREAGVPVGLSHHFWIVEVAGDEITFHPKLHNLHGDPRLSLPPEYGASMSAEDRVTWLFWEGDFSAREGWLHLDTVVQFVSSLGSFNVSEQGSSINLDADRRILELSQANENALLEVWSLRARLDEAEAQRQSSEESLRILREQVDRAIATLHETAADRDLALARLSPIDGVGPTALGVARGLHRLSERHPRLSSLIRRVVKVA